MSQTKTALVNQVALDLNLTGLGQSVDAEDGAFLRTRVTTIFADLRGREIVDVVDEEEIPDELFESLVQYVVLRIGHSYGRTMATQTDLDTIEDRMQKTTRPKKARRTLSTDPVLRHGARGTSFDFWRGE